MIDIRDQYYSEYKSQIITFNQELSNSIGLINDRVSITCKEKNFPCILYSSSMSNSKIIAKLDTAFFCILEEQKHKVSLNLSFKIDGLKKDLSFYLQSAVSNISKYENNSDDCYILYIDFIDKPPNDLILIFGNYLQQQSGMQKRCDTRINVSHEHNESLGLDLTNNVLFIDGNGKKCILSEISSRCAKILIHGEHKDFESGTNVMMLMKAKGLQGMGEILGSISRAEVIDIKQKLFSLVIQFNQEKIPPTYKTWISQCIDIINESRMNAS